MWHTFADATICTLLGVSPAALNDGLTATSAAADHRAADLVCAEKEAELELVIHQVATLALELEAALKSSAATGGRPSHLRGGEGRPPH